MILLIVLKNIYLYNMDNYVDPNMFEPYLVMANGQIDPRVANIIALCDKSNCINFLKSH